MSRSPGNNKLGADSKRRVKVLQIIGLVKMAGGKNVCE